MGAYRDRLYSDVYEVLSTNGPMTSGQIARALQPKYSNFRLSSCRMAKYLLQMRGKGQVEVAGSDDDRMTYKAVRK